MKKSILLLLGALMVVAAVAQGQEKKKSILNVSAYGDYGIVLQTNDFLRGENDEGEAIKRSNAVRMNLGWQMVGNEPWEYSHNFPTLGVGVGYTTYEGTDELGNTLSVYGFYNGVAKRWGRHEIRYDIELGLAYHTNYYDEFSHPNNVTIGSPVTVHIGLSPEYHYQISKHWNIGVGFGFTHFSNGAFRKPNKGMNIVSPAVKIAYNFEEFVPAGEKPTDRPTSNEIDVAVGYGFKRLEVEDFEDGPNEGCIYTTDYHNDIITLKGAFMHQYGHLGKWGGGLNVCYDNGLGATFTRNASTGKISKHEGSRSNMFNVGLLLSHELILGRMGVLTDLGAYVYQADIDDKKEPVFERLGLKIYLPGNFYCGANVLAHGIVADCVEWNIGYRIGLKSRKQ